MAGRADIEAGRAFVRLFLKNDLTKQMTTALRRMSAQLTTAGQSMARLGSSFTRMGVVAAAPFALALRTFQSFDDQMRRVQAVTGATGDMFDQLTAKAKELGSTTAFTASQAADGMAFLGQAGFSAQQILEGIPAVLDLAAAGAIDLGMAADIASNIAGGFGLASDEIGRVSHVLAQAASSSNVSIEELGEAFGKAAPAARAAGQSIEEAASALGILGDSGVKAGMAGTDVQNILVEMAKRADIAGVKTTDAAGNVRNMLDVMREVGTATAELSEAERVSFFIETFGKRSAKSALILSQANKRIDELRDKMASAEGRAKSMADTMEGGIGGAWRKFKSAVEGVAISIGEALAPALKTLADQFSKTLGRLKDYIEKNQGFIKAMALVAAGLIASGVALSAMGGILFGVGVALSVLVAAITALLSPVGLITTALVVGAVAWVKYSSSGKAAIGSILSAVRSLTEKAKTLFGSIVKAINIGDYRTAFAIIKAVGILAFNRIKDRAAWLFMTFIPGVASATLAGLGGAFVELIEQWKEPVSALWGLFIGLGSSALKFISGAFVSTVTKWGEQGALVWAAFKDLFVVYVNTMARIYSAVWNVLADTTADAVAKALNTSLESFVDSVLNILPAIAKAVAKAMSGKVGLAVESATLGLNLLQSDAAAGAGKDLLSFGDRILSAISAGTKGDASGVKVSEVLGDLGRGLVGSEVENMKRFGELLADSAGDTTTAFAAFSKSLEGVGGDTRAAFLEEFKGIFDGIEGSVDSELTTAAKAKLDELTSKVDAAAAVEAASKPTAAAGKPGGVIAAPGEGELGAGAEIAPVMSRVTQAVAVTFSAAAAAASGQLGTTQADPAERSRQKQLKAIEAQSKAVTATANETKLLRETMAQFVIGMAVR